MKGLDSSKCKKYGAYIQSNPSTSSGTFPVSVHAHCTLRTEALTKPYIGLTLSLVPNVYTHFNSIQIISCDLIQNKIQHLVNLHFATSQKTSYRQTVFQQNEALRIMI